jgi:hypothetical protein
MSLSSRDSSRPNLIEIGERITGPSCFGSPARTSWPPLKGRMPETKQNLKTSLVSKKNFMKKYCIVEKLYYNSEVIIKDNL